MIKEINMISLQNKSQNLTLARISFCNLQNINCIPNYNQVVTDTRVSSPVRMKADYSERGPKGANSLRCSRTGHRRHKCGCAFLRRGR